jgi:hypothetical protein
VDPRRLLPALAAVACACVVATLVVTLVPGPGRRADDAARPASGSEAVGSAPARILAAWDERRAAAWAAGDPEALTRMYVEGSRTGAADVRLLRHYRERGLSVAGLTTQVLAMDVVSASPSRLVLVVTDRLAGGRAVGGGAAPVALPSDRASTRRVVLRRDGGRWLVVEARDQASAAESTSRTSSSSKS